MGVRQNFRDLSTIQKSGYIEAVLKLKEDGVYDQIVQLHVDSMMHATPPAGAQFRPTLRNAAHRGPAFLPWHREYLLRFERALQDINPQINVPYWDWTKDAANTEASPLWDEHFMGGNGVEEEGWRVISGPFASRNGRWTLTVDTGNGGEALRRRFGKVVFRDRDGQPQEADYTLPTSADVQLAREERTYDMPPYNSRTQTWGFRNRLEGWIRRDGDPRVQTNGTQLHNRVHVYIGGSWWESTEQGQEAISGTMLLASSPNDPVFFLHHCFVDKLWADWQALQKRLNPGAHPHYVPISGGPLEHNLYDPMFPWSGTVTPASLLNHKELGYSYDTDDSEEYLNTLAVAVHKNVKDEGPQSGAIRSMFFLYE